MKTDTPSAYESQRYPNIGSLKGRLRTKHPICGVFYLVRCTLQGINISHIGKNHGSVDNYPE